MGKTTPFLGETEDRNQAFPDIKSLKVKIIQDPYGYYCREEHQRETTYSKNTIARYATCRNPRCQQGGIDLQNLVLFSGSGEYSFHCNGHEGTPKGRRKGDPCDNVFNITVAVEKST
jgi:hypothetical protein